LRHGRHRQPLPRYPDHPALAGYAAGDKTPGAGTSPATKSEPCSDTPALTVFGPRQGAANGSAVIIFPGGAYIHLAGDLEGREIADWFTARGFRAFVLSYRLSSNGYLLPVPLLDARRAIQTVRARATDYHISPNRIVVIGFSAGGHLAALAGTQFVAGSPDSEDPIDRASSRLDYLVLGYPWLDAITRDTTYLSYCKIFNLLDDKIDQCDQLRAKYDPVLFVTKDTPPTFIYHTFNDKTAAVERASSSTRRWSKPEFRPRCTSSPTASTAAAWAKAIPRSTNGPAFSKTGSARKAVHVDKAAVGDKQ